MTCSRTTELTVVSAAIHDLVLHADEQPSLSDVADRHGLSPSHFQRVFQRRVGLSPKRFLQHVTVETAKDSLAACSTILDAAFDCGLSGPGRLHDHFVTLEALTPGEFGRRGEGLTVRHGGALSPLGDCRVAWTDRGICGLGFGEGPLDGRGWEVATRVRDDRAARDLVDRVFSGDAGALSVLVRGTNFQVQVWRALLRIPTGVVTSYSDLAARIGHAGSARAVAGAVARNAVAVLIPCHRVLRASGALGGYRWGLERKRALLALEAGRQASG
jgi:AraC family transcriptional regulator of adaptative response/methylated-DNA-[protein]-cysteine methyltransferase